ncbi:unnamed protein product [marine sediment metagenome]|uniref:Uncharacterized protein n=1 Tax=marine sediment metagenome TaxID=412755 RepID=X0Z906_9ZZZZ
MEITDLSKEEILKMSNKAGAYEFGRQKGYRDGFHNGCKSGARQMQSQTETTKPDGKSIIETGVAGLSVKIGDDGVWINIKSSKKQYCSFNLVNHANNNCATICKRAILDWCTDMMSQKKDAQISTDLE